MGMGHLNLNLTHMETKSRSVRFQGLLGYCRLKMAMVAVGSRICVRDCPGVGGRV